MNTRIEEQAWAAAQEHQGPGEEHEILDEEEEDGPDDDFKPIEARIAEEDPAKQLTD